MKILTWNIACLPRIINILRNPKNVINQIIDKIEEEKPNIVCLQEVFDYGIREQLEYYFKKNNYNTYYSEDNFCCLPKNGLFIASNFPISYMNELDYYNREGLECLINKGVLTIGVYHPSGKEIIIHNTHMQSDTMLWHKGISTNCRRKQNLQLNNYLNRYKSKTQFLIGDLNDTYEYVKQNNYFEKCFINLNEIITYPSTKKQLDYIICNTNYETDFRTICVKENSISDHNIFICEAQI
jgi:endonuclease/exonuclease/phosphatase family metal-dependent hydrolase